MKISQIPHEVAQNIAGHLTGTETLACLTVCSSLHFAMLEALYKIVFIDNTTVFRNFIFAVAHHRHKANLMVKKIELRFSKYTPGDQRMITFTEFELLARHCINLTSISFLEFQHWKLMNELDFTQLWSRLRQIPTVYPRSNDCLEVYHKIKDRLTEISVFGGLETHFSLRDLVSKNGRFKSIKIDDRGASVSSLDIQQIHSTSNQLESLVLLANLKPFEENNTTPVISSLKHFECAINHPHSAWFNLCRQWYKNIDSLAIQSISWESRPQEDTSMAIVDAILLLFQETSIQKVTFNLKKNMSFTLFVENVITEVIYKCIEWDIQSNFALKFVYAIDTVMSEGAPSIQCTLSRHHLQHFCIQCKITNLDCKVNSLEQFIMRLIGSRLTHLTLSHKITADHFESGLQSTPVFLDRILDTYTHLKSLVISMQVTKFPIQNRLGDWFLEVALSDESNTFHTMNRRLSQLEQVEISSAEIDWAIYPYLFRRCSHLSSIVLKDCNLQDEETLLALEYLCLANNVKLSIQ